MPRPTPLLLAAFAIALIGSQASARPEDAPKKKPTLERVAVSPASRFAPLAVPSNDQCSGAEVIPSAGPFPYLTSVKDITDATTTGDPPVPSCQSNVSRSVWYTFTPAVTATYQISSCPEAPTATTLVDNVISIYTSAGGCAGPFTEVPTTASTNGCDDDACFSGLNAVIPTELSSGTTYFIVGWRFSALAPSPGEGDLQLQISSHLTPANDACAGVQVLTLDTPVDGSTVSANNDYRLSGGACFTGLGQTASPADGRDVVYSFTAPSADTYSFKVSSYVPSNGPSDLVLYTSSACLGGGPPILVPCVNAANRHGGAAAEEVFCQSMGLGEEVFIFVDADQFSAGATFTLEANRCVRESELNNEPDFANRLTCGMEGSIAGDVDTDFFSLGTPSAGSRVFALVDGAASNDNDIDLRVTTDTATLEYDDVDADTPFGSLSPVIAGTPLTGVPAFLRMSQFIPSVNSEPYRLYAVVEGPFSDAAPEWEPNDTIAQANQAGRNYFSGALGGPAPFIDVDLFRFTATAKDEIFLALDGDPLRDNTPINAALDLLDQSGTVLLSVNDVGSASKTTPSPGNLAGTTPSSPGEALVYRARATGTYYARVRSGTSSTGITEAGDYLLSITLNCVSTVTTDVNGTTEGIGLSVEPVAPNPVGALASIRYRLLVAGPVRLRVYDSQGRLVATLANGIRNAGWNTVSLDTSRLENGLYFCRLDAGRGSRTEKMVVLK